MQEELFEELCALDVPEGAVIRLQCHPRSLEATLAVLTFQDIICNPAKDSQYYPISLVPLYDSRSSPHSCLPG